MQKSAGQASSPALVQLAIINANAFQSYQPNA